jgi:hypothetical protein
MLNTVSRKQHRVNNSNNSKFQASIALGFLYCAASIDRPHWLKIGATSRHPMERLEEFKKHYSLREVTPVFFFELSMPVTAEFELHKRLRSYNVRIDRHDSCEWFDVPPAKALKDAMQVISDLRLRRWGTEYVNRRFIERFGPDGSLWRLKKLCPVGL